MAIAATTVWECNASATASNVNGGGFNPSNANMITDFTATSATGNSPVISSASYNFVAGDVNAWFYVKSGTNWTPGWYQIASVASNQATLSAAIGAAIQVTNGVYTTNTVAGCATTASPTGGTATVDYSQGTAASFTKTDMACTTPSTTITSATGVFTKVMVGNLLHITAVTGAGTLVGWYEIVSYVSGTSVVLDRTPAPGAGSLTNGTYYVGGAMSLNSTLDDDFFDVMTVTNGTAANIIWMKNGAFSLGESVSTLTAGGARSPMMLIGYNSLRGDITGTSNRPSIAMAAFTLTILGNWEIWNVTATGTGTVIFSLGSKSKLVNCSGVNSSTTANRNAVTGNLDAVVERCEFVSYRGDAIDSAGGSGRGMTVRKSYIHDSNIGITITPNTATDPINIQDNLISDNVTTALAITGSVTAVPNIDGNTFYGAENKLGKAIDIAAGGNYPRVTNNIFYGFTTAVTHGDTNTVILDDYNDYYNNTTDVSASANWQKGIHDVAINPSFTSVAQLTGSTATTSGSVLTQSGGDFSTVTDNVDFVYIKSGTGITAGKYKITSHTSDTITLDIAPGTSATADKVWQITTGHNFMPTGAI